MIHLSWRAHPNVFGHLIKLSWERGSPLGLHTHEYPELFWLDHGACRHRINGSEEILEKGDIIFVRARDRHQLIATAAGRFTMTNLECQPALVKELKRRHPAPFAKWFDERRPYPLTVRLTASQLQQLQQAAMNLTSRRLDALSIEGFFLDLARTLVPSESVIANISLCPDWLKSALHKAQSREVFSQGSSGLARAANRSPEHVARLCMSLLQKTPTEIVEECRMNFAERQLRLTSMSILDISLECGYSTTAQFHRVFKKHYQRTPLQYRNWIRGEPDEPSK